MRKQKEITSKGYTLIELIIVMAVVGILGIMGVNNYLKSQKRALFDNNFYDILSSIRQARNYALTSRAIRVGAEKKVPAGGYGIYIDHTQTPPEVKIFVDTWNISKGLAINVESKPPVNPDHIFSPGLDETEISLAFEPSTQISKISTATGGLIEQPFTMTFLPPSGESYITNNVTGESYDEVTITVRHKNEPYTKSFSFNRVSRFPVIQ